MKKFSSWIGKGLTALVLALSFAGLVWAAQGVAKSSTYYTSALTTSSNIARVAPVGRLTVDIVTASASGVPSVTPTIQGVDSAGNVYTLCAGAAIAAAGTTLIHVGPGMTVGTGSCNLPVPDLWNIKFVNASGVGGHGITATTYYNTAP